jgi:beta-lactamase class A
MTRSFGAVCLGMLLTCVATTSVSASERFDVSYLWHRDVDAVVAYRERVARVLGPAVAKNLKVVSAGQKVGLVYARGGDRASAVAVARVHSNLLRARGLEEAAPMRAAKWRVIKGAPRVTARITVRQPRGGARASAGKARALPRPRPAPHRTPKGSSLETIVEQHIKALRSQGKIADDERTGWSVYDFTTGEKLVTINEDMPFQAASLIKPFIATAFFNKVESGQLKYGPRARTRMERMIQRSDNRATNWLTRRVGGPRTVEKLLKKTHPDVFRQTSIVEYIPANGRTYRNQASVHDYSRFLYALWEDRLPGSGELKRLMALPGPDRIVREARTLPRSARVFNKTGSTGRLCGDMGIVLVKDAAGREYPYTVIGVIEKQRRASNYTTWIRSRGQIIGEVSDLVYTGIAERHGI